MQPEKISEIEKLNWNSSKKKILKNEVIFQVYMLECTCSSICRERHTELVQKGLNRTMLGKCRGYHKSCGIRGPSSNSLFLLDGMMFGNFGYSIECPYLRIRLMGC